MTQSSPDTDVVRQGDIIHHLDWHRLCYIYLNTVYCKSHTHRGFQCFKQGTHYCNWAGCYELGRALGLVCVLYIALFSFWIFLWSLFAMFVSELTDISYRKTEMLLCYVCSLIVFWLHCAGFSFTWTLVVRANLRPNLMNMIFIFNSFCTTVACPQFCVMHRKTDWKSAFANTWHRNGHSAEECSIIPNYTI